MGVRVPAPPAPSSATMLEEYPTRNEDFPDSSSRAPSSSILFPMFLRCREKDRGAAGGLSSPRSPLEGSGDTTSEEDSATLNATRRQLYCRALIYASTGHRGARDWICGHVALTTSDSQLVETILQADVSADDVARLLSHVHDPTRSAMAERDRIELFRCFMYDAMKAAVSIGTWTLPCKSRLSEVAAMLNMPCDFMSELEQLVLEELEVSDQKRRILESDDAQGEHR